MRSRQRVEATSTPRHRVEATATPRQRVEAAVVTPNRSRRRSETDSHLQNSQNQWHQHSSRNSYGSKSPAPQRDDRLQGSKSLAMQRVDRFQEKSPAPQRDDRCQAGDLDRRQISSEQRCHSEPRGASNQAHSYPSNLPGKQAVEVAKAREDMAATARRMADSADQMKLVGCPDPDQYATFLSDHASMMQLAKTLQLSGPPSTAQADPAALVALNLLMVACSRNSMKKASSMPMAAISENSCKMQPRSVSPMVAPSSRAQSPSPVPCSFAEQRMVQMLVPVVRHAPYDELRPWNNKHAPYDELRPWNTNRSQSSQSMMRVPSVENFRIPLRLPRRSSKYTVVNPRSGEKLVISSAVPFRWRQSKRLRIVDPRTGEEVFPLQEDDDSNHRDGHSCAGVMSRVSFAASRPSIASSTTSSSAAPRSRKSLAGRAVQQGGNWALEPASGGHWDWPLSRQERKDRILMLSQLELLAEIEDMQNAAMGDNKDCA